MRSEILFDWRFPSVNVNEKEIIYSVVRKLFSRCTENYATCNFMALLYVKYLNPKQARVEAIVNPNLEDSLKKDVYLP